MFFSVAYSGEGGPTCDVGLIYQPRQTFLSLPTLGSLGVSSNAGVESAQLSSSLSMDPEYVFALTTDITDAVVKTSMSLYTITQGTESMGNTLLAMRMDLDFIFVLVDAVVMCLYDLLMACYNDVPFSSEEEELWDSITDSLYNMKKTLSQLRGILDSTISIASGLRFFGAKVDFKKLDKSAVKVAQRNIELYSKSVGKSLQKIQMIKSARAQEETKDKGKKKRRAMSSSDSEEGDDTYKMLRLAIEEIQQTRKVEQPILKTTAEVSEDGRKQEKSSTTREAAYRANTDLPREGRSRDEGTSRDAFYGVSQDTPKEHQKRDESMTRKPPVKTSREPSKASRQRDESTTREASFKTNREPSKESRKREVLRKKKPPDAAAAEASASAASRRPSSTKSDKPPAIDTKALKVLKEKAAKNFSRGDYKSAMEPLKDLLPHRHVLSTATLHDTQYKLAVCYAHDKNLTTSERLLLPLADPVLSRSETPPDKLACDAGHFLACVEQKQGNLSAAEWTCRAVGEARSALCGENSKEVKESRGLLEEILEAKGEVNKY